MIAGVIGAEFDVLSSITKKYYGIASFGRAYGVVCAVFQLGAALGATALPLSRLHLGSYAPGLIDFAVILAVAAGWSFMLRPPRLRRIALWDRHPPPRRRANRLTTETSGREPVASSVDAHFDVARLGRRWPLQLVLQPLEKLCKRG